MENGMAEMEKKSGRSGCLVNTMQVEDTDIIEMICNFLYTRVPLCTMYIEMTFWTFGHTSSFFLQNLLQKRRRQANQYSFIQFF